MPTAARHARLGGTKPERVFHKRPRKFIAMGYGSIAPLWPQPVQRLAVIIDGKKYELGVSGAGMKWG